MSANQPLNFALHYEDIVKFSWGGCDGVDISQILIISYTYNINLIFFYFLFKIHLLHNMELNDLDLNPLY